MVLIWWRLANHTYSLPFGWSKVIAHQIFNCPWKYPLEGSSLRYSGRDSYVHYLLKVILGRLGGWLVLLRDMVKTRHVCPGWPVSKLLVECQLEWLWHCLILLYVSLKHHYHSTVWQTAVKLQGQGIGKPLLFLSDTLWFRGGGGGADD